MEHPTKCTTRAEILKVATRLFLQQGYTQTYVTKIAREVGISLGNLTFHFPTKELLLTELIRHLCDYHLLVMEQEVDEGVSSLLAYLLEITAIMAVCEENPIAKDLYTAAYVHSPSLLLTRQYDTRKAKSVFREFCPDWTDEDFAAAENVVSGIEYASFREESAYEVSLAKRISVSLNIVMAIYHVPRQLRQEKIDKILALDYRRIGRQFIDGFEKYMSTIYK